ncbi:Ribonuclease H2 subunit B [Linnemannia zychae]|nr:Ribonuclease H2 subunit B [Linnemannia zychae]
MATSNQQRICIGPKVPKHVDHPITMLLPSPSSGLPARFVIQDGKLYEMQMIDSEGLRSWFIGETIQSDGALYLITPFDPVFMFIPILDIMRQKTSSYDGKYLMLEGIFGSSNDQYPSMRHLADLKDVDRYLSLVCDVRDSTSSGAMKTFRLDDEKVMEWLKRKMETFVSKFETIPALVDSIAYTESLPAACRSEAITQSVLRLISANLSESWATKLAENYQFPELDKLESRSQLPSLSDFNKRSMDLDDEPKAKEVKKPKMSVGQRKLAKASIAGMKPMTSFFAKKT